MKPVLEVRHLEKLYGRVSGGDDVTFEVRERQAVGFLGPNGAGKTTTLRMLAGYLAPTRGHVRVMGVDLEDDPRGAKRAIGYMPEGVPLYPEMRVEEYLRFRAELKGVAKKSVAAFVEEALALVKAADVKERLVGELSKGTRQRVGLADALVARPPILILDEPTAGLDPNQIREMRALVRSLGKERAVLVSTHILSEVEATCDRVVVIGKGKLLAEGPTASIRAKASPEAVEVLARGPSSLAENLRAVAGVARIEINAAGEGLVALRCVLREGAEAGLVAEELAARVQSAGAQLRELRATGGGLEEVFGQLTDAVDAPASRDA